MPKADKDFSPTTPSETRDLRFDYVDALRGGETISSATLVCSVIDTDTGATEDSDPASRLSGAPAIADSDVSGSDNVVVQRFTGGVDGNKYLVVCRATTNAGQVLEMSDHLWCRVAA